MQPGTEFYREHWNIYVTYTFLITSFVQNDQVYKKERNCCELRDRKVRSMYVEKTVPK
jgi:hypothetical protein